MFGLFLRIGSEFGLVFDEMSYGADLRDAATWRPALAALGEDFTPISDMRASAGYRRDIAQALLEKALGEIAGTPSTHTRVVGRREHIDAAAS